MMKAILAWLAPWLKWWPLALALIAFGFGWTVNGWRLEAKHATSLQEQIDQHAKAEQDAALKSADLEIQLELLRRNISEINRRFINETRSDAYRCGLPANGLSLLNAARAGDHPASEPDRSVP